MLFFNYIALTNYICVRSYSERNYLSNNFLVRYLFAFGGSLLRCCFAGRCMATLGAAWMRSSNTLEQRVRRWGPGRPVRHERL